MDGALKWGKLFLTTSKTCQSSIKITAVKLPSIGNVQLQKPFISTLSYNRYKVLPINQTANDCKRSSLLYSSVCISGHYPNCRNVFFGQNNKKPDVCLCVSVLHRNKGCKMPENRSLIFNDCQKQLASQGNLVKEVPLYSKQYQTDCIEIVIM